VTVSENRTAYTVEQAAFRVKKSTRTIEAWIRGGMPHVKVGGRDYIGHDDLLATYRAKMMANPSRTRRGIEVGHDFGVSR